MRGPKIIACIKQVPDPEGPPSAFEVDSETKKIRPVGIPPVINPFDENALEAALQLKEEHGGSVVAISVGEKLAKPMLTKALGVGADDLILLEDEHFCDLDSRSIALVLFAAIQKVGKYDLVLAGRQSGDWGFGQTASILAEILRVPCISVAQSIKIEDREVLAGKLRRNGYEIVRAPMPVLITVDSQIGTLRHPSLKALVLARKTPVTYWGIRDLELDPLKLETNKIFQLSPPPSRERQVLFIQGESLEEKGEKLALILRQDRLI
jgi:electron transfer flavoprotein beta subunit